MAGRALSVAVLLSGLAAQATAQCETDLLRPAGLEAFDAFGWSVAIQGNQLFVSAIADDDVDANAGAVYVFGRTQTGWVEAQKITVSDATVNNEFGNSMSVSGNRLLLGAHKQGPGSVYVFEGQPSGWVQVQKLSSSDGQPQFHFGHSVQLEGDSAVIGQMRDDHAGFEAGSAYVFEHDGTGFVEVAKLTAGDAGVGDRFGRTTDIEGDFVIVCAHKHAAEGGAVYVYARDDAGTPSNRLDDAWPEIQKIVPADNAAGDRFGRSLSISGTTAMVGATLHDVGGGVTSGAVYVYERDDAGTPADPLDDSWFQVQKLVPPDGQSGDEFGKVVRVRGDTALVGAAADDTAAPDAGSVYVFERQGATWSFTFELTASDAQSGDALGDEMSVDLLGAEIVGAAWATDALGTISGSAYVWRRPAVVYCTAKTNSQGCTPRIAAAGNPSLTDPSAFPVTATDVLNFRNGLCFYGRQGRAALPFQGGTLCMLPPLRRTPILNSGGSTPPTVDCSGTYTFDLNAWLQGGNDPNVGEGDVLNLQWWTRDPSSSFGTGLSDAVEVVVCE